MSEAPWRRAIVLLGGAMAALTVVVSARSAPSPSAAALAQDPATQPATQPQRPGPRDRNRERTRRLPAAQPPTLDVAPLVSRGVEFLLSAQEGETRAEWPYEGVYRVQRQIPIGYRVGGTALCATALIRAPGYDADQPRQLAVRRAVEFIIESVPHPLMNPEYDGGYDVRGWGYTCGLAFLLELKSRGLIPPDFAEPVDETILHNVDAIVRTEINQVGGWNYARQQGRDAISPPSPFMTAPTLQALFEAKAQGYAVDQSVIDRALATLEQARTPSGSVRYSGVNGAASSEPVPGAVGRMLAVETTLFLAGRSSVAGVRGALDAFIVHWDWLNQRRAQPGTHEPPYGIAPYYFYFAHYYAAQAIEMLPARERGEYRRRLHDLLMRTRGENGTWNDRVFERSSNFGTAMAIMALMMPDTPTPSRWQ